MIRAAPPVHTMLIFQAEAEMEVLHSVAQLMAKMPQMADKNYKHKTQNQTSTEMKKNIPFRVLIIGDQ